MKAIILCPGPSLKGYEPPDDDSIIIAVNRAAESYHCNYWSVGDYEAFMRYKPMGLPIIWTHHNTHYRLNQYLRSLCEWKLYRRDEQDRWTIFSATAALMLAKELNATTVEIIGADMTGTADFTGAIDPEANRSETRWSLERSIWAETINHLRSCGIEVKESQPA